MSEKEKKKEQPKGSEESKEKKEDTKSEGTEDPSVAKIAKLEQELKAIQEKIASSSEEQEESEEEKPDKSEKEKPVKRKVDPLHGELADALKESLGEAYDPDWDKLPLGERIRTMKIAKAILKKKEDKAKEKVPKEGQGPSLDGSIPSPKKKMIPQINYTELGKKLNPNWG